MDHPVTEPAGAEAEVEQTAPESQGGEQNDATQFYSEDQPVEAEPELEDDDTLDDDDDADEPADKPTIVQAVGLKAEEQERFAHLSPEDQRFVADVLQRRHVETKNGLEAATMKAREAERTAADQVAASSQAHAQQLRALVNEFAPKPPPIELARTHPGEYQYQKALFDQDMADYTALVGSIEGIGGQSAQHLQQREQEQTQERIKGLMNIPEFANDESRPQLLASVEKHGIEYLGYDLERLGQMDATDLRALMKSQKDAEDAAKWRNHQKRRNERPRQAGGRFSAAPAGSAPAQTSAPTDDLKVCYPND